jgi:hypothetical protein
VYNTIIDHGMVYYVPANFPETLFTEYSLNVPYIFPECSLNVP